MRAVYKNYFVITFIIDQIFRPPKMVCPMMIEDRQVTQEISPTLPKHLRLTLIFINEKWCEHYKKNK